MQGTSLKEQSLVPPPMQRVTTSHGTEQEGPTKAAELQHSPHTDVLS